MKVKLSGKAQLIIGLIILNFAMFMFNIYLPMLDNPGRHMMTSEDLFLISCIPECIVFSIIYIVEERSKWV